MASSLPQVAGDSLLEFAMQRLRAADEAHRGHAEAEFVERAPGRRDDFGVMGETEVIVGAEIDHLALALRTGDADAPALRPGDQPLALGQPGGVDLAQDRSHVAHEGLGHRQLPQAICRETEAAPRNESRHTRNC